MIPSHKLGATDALNLIRQNELTVEAWAQSCLDRIAEREPEIRAWAFVDPDEVIKEARRLDSLIQKGPLHGLPIGVKDIINTKDMPTEYNSPIYKNHRPSGDAACIKTLRAAGALIFGKTTTVEFGAAGHKPSTRNPIDLRRTPGGSSTGSAAAVADFHVPIALGTQTGGSTMRPASYCGVFAIKPTWGSVSSEGIKRYLPICDTPSWFARSTQDIELLCDAFSIEDDQAAARQPLSDARIAFCRSPVWEAAEAASRDAFDYAAEILRRSGADIHMLELPGFFSELPQAWQTMSGGDGFVTFLSEFRSHYDLLHSDFHAIVENRNKISRSALMQAHDLAAKCRMDFDDIAKRYHAVLTPSACGEAPIGLLSTGTSTFNRIWSLLHVPCINIPVSTGPNDMPIGLTLTGPRFNDRRLLKVAESISEILITDTGARRCGT